MDAVKEMMELALACVDISVRRPTMKKVVEELERIQHREIGHLQAQLGEEIGVVTLGSELFKWAPRLIGSLAHCIIVIILLLN